MHMKKILSIIFVSVLIITQSACMGRGKAGASESSYAEDWLLNTFCYIKVFEPDREELIKEAFALARGYENKLSRTVPQSQVVTSNYDEESKALVDKALELEELSGGAFCIHLGAVSELWDFSGTSGGPFVPSEAEIKAALEKRSIDLGAIAKGFIADRTAEFLRENGVGSALISLGGNIVCIGEKPGGSDWSIGIERPFASGGRLEERETAGTVKAAPGTSVVTSGIYERCFTAEDGTFYHHILDPESGYPCETDVVSATVIGESSCICDALATIAVVLGSEAAQDFIDGYNSAENCGYSYVLLTEDGRSIASAGAGFVPAQ